MAVLLFPTGYQSLSGTFSGASPQPIEQGLLTGNNGNIPLSVEDIFMMSGSIPNPQPQGGQLPPGGQPQLMPGGQPQGTQFVSGGQPQGQYATYGTVHSSRSTPDSICTPRSTPVSIYTSRSTPVSVFASRVSTSRSILKSRLSNHLKVNHMFKEWELHLTIINPILNPAMDPQYPQPVMGQYPGMN
jgi:hypothetical protein